MILVDTSVWIDHLRDGDETLASLLHGSSVLMHPFVVGELACGNLRHREPVLGLLQKLPPATVATDTEVWFFIERHLLMGQGIGYIDAHLLASASLSDTARLWTRDTRLRKVAAELGQAYETD
jgi:hypothetical protein